MFLLFYFEIFKFIEGKSPLLQ